MTHSTKKRLWVATHWLMETLENRNVSKEDLMPALLTVLYEVRTATHSLDRLPRNRSIHDRRRESW